MTWNAYHRIRVCVHHITYLGTDWRCCPTTECTFACIVIVLGITCRMVIGLIRRWIRSCKSFPLGASCVILCPQTELNATISIVICKFLARWCVQQVALADGIYKWSWYCAFLPSCRLNSSVSCRLIFAGYLQKSKVEIEILHLSEIKFLVTSIFEYKIYSLSESCCHKCLPTDCQG